jgi:hypothetical protein
MHGTGVKVTVFQLSLSQQKPLILRFDLRFYAIKCEVQGPIVISTGLRATGLRF